MATRLGNSEIKPIKLRLKKLTLCHILLVAYMRTKTCSFHLEEYSVNHFQFSNKISIYRYYQNVVCESSIIYLKMYDNCIKQSVTKIVEVTQISPTKYLQASRVRKRESFAMTFEGENTHVYFIWCSWSNTVSSHLLIWLLKMFF